MRINLKNNTTRFSELSIGDVFHIDEGTYIVTERVDYRDNLFNCVNLESGKYGYAGSSDIVVKVECELNEI